jgi:hypothetical protein
MPQKQGYQRKWLPNSVVAGDPYAYGVAVAEAVSGKDSGEGGIEDIFGLKKESARTKISLILGWLRERRHTFRQNLRNCYASLLRIGNLRIQLPFDKTYYKGREWSDLNKMELQVIEQINRERSELFRDCSPFVRDLIQALCEYQAEKSKDAAFNLGSIDELINGDAW